MPRVLRADGSVHDLAAEAKAPGSIVYLEPGDRLLWDAPVEDGIEAQLDRLDVENGDILTLRTRHKLTRDQADELHDEVARLARRHGVRDVSVLVLDNCTDLTVARPATTLMQNQAPRSDMVTVYKPASVGKSESLMHWVDGVLQPASMQHQAPRPGHVVTT